MSHRHSQSVGRISSGLLSRLRCYANDGKHSSEQQSFDTRGGDGLFSLFSDQNRIIFLGSPLQ